MARKPKISDITNNSDESTEVFLFTSLPMKYREICRRYAVGRGYAHQEIVKMKFKIGKNDRMVHGIETV